MVQYLPGPPARMCAVAAVVEYLPCAGHHSAFAAVRVGPVRQRVRMAGPRKRGRWRWF